MRDLVRKGRAPTALDSRSAAVLERSGEIRVNRNSGRLANTELGHPQYVLVEGRVLIKRKL